jgi:hypothetical protein
MKIAFFGDINYKGQDIVNKLVEKNDVELSYVSLCCNRINVPDTTLFNEYLSDSDKILVAVKEFDKNLLKDYEDKTQYICPDKFNLY